MIMRSIRAGASENGVQKEESRIHKCQRRFVLSERKPFRFECLVDPTMPVSDNEQTNRKEYQAAYKTKESIQSFVH